MVAVLEKLGIKIDPSMMPLSDRCGLGGGVVHLSLSILSSTNICCSHSLQQRSNTPPTGQRAFTLIGAMGLVRHCGSPET